MTTTVSRTRYGRRLLAMLGVQALALLVVLTGPVPAAQAQSYTAISGSGSTWSANAIGTWIGDVSANGIRVNFSPVGSTAGRQDYANRQTVFGVSEIPFQEGVDEKGNQDSAKGRKFGYMPIVAGGTAFMYHVKVNGKAVRGLRLAGETIAKIFTGKITNWNDPAITADNNGVALPDKKIIPVVRSDGSGTTAQFTTYLDKRYPGLWREFQGKAGLTSYYPNPDGKFVGQSGSDRVAGYISSPTYGDGTIGYVEYSYAKAARDWPVAKVLNDAGYYALPTDYNVAVALTQARIETANKDPRFYLTQILDGVYGNADKRTYPLSSYSYMIIPTAVEPPATEATGRTLSAFAFYFLCEGQKKAGVLGYSPLPYNLVKAGFDQVNTIPGREQKFVDPSQCGNPTFDPNDVNRNVLAEKAPNPPECDQRTAGPCGEKDGVAGPNGKGGAAGGGAGAGGAGAAGGNKNGQGTGGAGGSGPGAGGAAANNGAGGAGAGAAAPGTAGANGAGAAGAIDPETGLPVGSNGGITTNEASSVTTELAGFREDSTTTALGALAALELLLVLVVPALVARQLARRRSRQQ